MSIENVIKQIITKEKLQQQEKEKLKAIANITTPKFAEKAADVLGSQKQGYEFRTYLGLLDDLESLLLAGMPDILALKQIQGKDNIETILAAWRENKS